MFEPNLLILKRFDLNSSSLNSNKNFITKELVLKEREHRFYYRSIDWLNKTTYVIIDILVG